MPALKESLVNLSSIGFLVVFVMLIYYTDEYK